ncbi:OmpA family protein [Roseomonas sp. CCTCC AB2023176]|uniref:OmpA family protein n=1 Tax=Roseomonas sp. CCTCC AB2023176 TaxID=3342640 RepID=UPI0035E18C93
MSRSLFPAACLAALFGAAALPEPAAAQSPSALDMIQRLQPGSGTRGIRRPGAETPPAEQAAPTLSPGATVSPAAPVAAAPARPAQTPASQSPPPMATTAPPEVPAVSITVQFATGSWTITPAAERALTPLGQALASPQLSAYRFRIEGHTDTVGPDVANRELSQRRAEAVRDYLVKRFGVTAERLEAIGLGESQLLIPTGDNVSDVRNRRVQVLNLGS